MLNLHIYWLEGCVGMCLSYRLSGCTRTCVHCSMNNFGLFLSFALDLSSALNSHQVFRVGRKITVMPHTASKQSQSPVLIYEPGRACWVLTSFNGVSLIWFEFVPAVAERTLPLAVLLMSILSHSGYGNLQVVLYITYNYHCHLPLEGYSSALHITFYCSFHIKNIQNTLEAWCCLFIDLVFWCS